MIGSRHLEAIKAVLDLNKSQRDPFRRFTILAMQLANVGKCIEYIKAYPSTAEACRAELKVDLSDLLVQVISLIVLYNLDPQQILELGIERLSEFKKKRGFVE